MTEEIARPIGIDLFCGAGGMSLGFEQAGFDIVAAVDSESVHVATHKVNFPHCQTIKADLSLMSGKRLRKETNLGDREVDVVFGGSPCGGFSIIGRRKFDDSRNKLLATFARLVVGLQPKYVVVENVRGLLIDPMTLHLEAFRDRLAKYGYSIVFPPKFLDAYDFGVPQCRERVFILGHRNDLCAPEYPTSQFENDADHELHRLTVWDAISDLPEVNDFESLLEFDAFDGELPMPQSDYARMLRGLLKDPEDLSHPRAANGRKLTGCMRTQHTDAVIARFEMTVPGGREEISKFPRLARDGICPTLRAGTNRDRGSHMAVRPIHPDHPRCITVREAARLHSYPDWFQFHPTKWRSFMQIGNSVPPLLSRAIACSIYRALNATTNSYPD